jgi:subtilase family serine protease/alpha-tubulin suppressor-like RCC1 family protein
MTAPLPASGTLAALGGMVSSSLDASDRLSSGPSSYHYEDYVIAGAVPGTALQIILDARDPNSNYQNNPYLEIINAESEEIVAWTGMSGEGIEHVISSVRFTPQAGITYRARASFYSLGWRPDFGPFTLRSQAAITAPLQGSLAADHGVLSGRLDAGDVHDPSLPWQASEDYALTGIVAGQWYELRIVAEPFDINPEIIDAATGQSVPYKFNRSRYWNESILVFQAQAGINYRARLRNTTYHTTSYQQGLADWSAPFTLNTRLLTNQPDVLISAASAPISASVGTSVDVSWTVETRGGHIASSQEDDEYHVIYLSKDPSLDARDIWISSAQFDNFPISLEPGQSLRRTKSISIPSVSSAGQYYLIINSNTNDDSLADANDRIAIPITIDLNSSDLQISAATAPASASVGSSITVSWTGSNLGTANAAENWYDSVYLSADSTFDRNDIKIGTFSAEAASPLSAYGGSYNLSKLIAIPSVPSAGLYHLIFQSDTYGDQGESNESNNTFALPINLDLVSPDLQITAATAPATATLGRPFNLSWRVTNTGATAADSEWDDGIFLSTDAVFDASDLYVDEFARPSGLDAGSSYHQSETIDLPDGITAGQYYLIIQSDYDFDAASDQAYFPSARQGEANEANNSLVLPISIDRNGHDLQVTEATAPATASIGSEISVSWTVENTGAAESTGNWNGIILLSSDPVYDDGDFDIRINNFTDSATLPLAAGASHSHTRTVSIPHVETAGSYYLLFRTYDNSYYETRREIDDSNNVLAVPINLDLNGSDLQITAATAPALANPGGTIDVSWTVSNLGNRPANQQNNNSNEGWFDAIFLSRDTIYDPNYYSGDRYLGSRSSARTSSLAPGANYANNITVSLPNGIAPGAYHLIIKTDAINSDYSGEFDGYQGETNESNNTFTLPIQIGGIRPDLVVSSTSAPASAAVGERIDVSWTINNTSAAVTNSQWWDTVVFSTDPIYDAGDVVINAISATGPGLAANGQYTQLRSFIVPSTTSAGQHYLIFKADFSDLLQETNETNNILITPINIRTGPDLSISAATAPSTASAGSPITISWTVNNSGVAATTNEWSDFVYLSRDSIYDPDDSLLTVSNGTGSSLLAPGGGYSKSTTINLPSARGAGDYQLLFRANPYGVQPEINRSNNDIALPLTITSATVSQPVISLEFAGGPRFDKVSEDGTAPLQVLVRRTGNTTLPLDVGFTIGGTASFGIDYSLRGISSLHGNGSGSISFAAGASIAIISITPDPETLDDTPSEGSETIALRLTAASNYSLEGAGLLTATIVDNDGPAGTLARAPVAAAWPVRSRTETRNLLSFAALKGDGSVVSWGTPESGGDSSAVRAQLSSGVSQIFSSSGAFAALKGDGSVITWGLSGFGGNSSAVASLLSSGVRQIASTTHAFAALKEGGSVVTWGDPTYGGNSAAVSSRLSSGVSRIFSTDSAFAALKDDGSVVTWGLAGGSSSDLGSQLAAGVVDVFSGDSHFVALKEDGSILVWGVHNAVETPPSGQLSSGVIQVYPSGAAFAALKNDGSVVSWGEAGGGGDSSAVSHLLGSGVVRIAATGLAFAALKSNGSVVTWGHSIYGGDSFSVREQLAEGVVEIVANSDAFAALKGDGSVITWGSPESGGDSSSVRPQLTSGVVQIVQTGRAFAALKADGSLVTWGAADAGGNSSSVASSLASGVSQVFANLNAFAALKVDGSLVTWGNATSGGDSSGVASLLSADVVSMADPSQDDRLSHLPVISLTVAPGAVLEDGADPLLYTFSRTGPTSGPLTVLYRVAGSASLGTDYVGIPVSGSVKAISFAAGSSVATVVVDPSADAGEEPDETVALTLVPTSRYLIGTPMAVIGIIGNDDTFTTIEAQGNAKLLRRGDGKVFAEFGAGIRQEITSPWGISIGSDSSEWQAIAVETIGSTNKLLWRNNTANFLHVWNLDANWSWTSASGVNGFNTQPAYNLESDFQVDANRDGIIGTPFTTIEAQGNAKLLQRADGKVFAEFGAGIRQEITSPWGISIGSDSSEWQALAVETIGSTNKLLWRNNTANFLHVWNLDANWSWTSASGVNGFNTQPAYNLESDFQVDANRDGIIGTPFTTIEAQGNAKLLQRADGKAFAEFGAGIRQEITSPWGISIGSDSSEWQAIAVETIGSTNKLLWRNNTANFLHVWNLDANWSWQSSTGIIDPLSSAGTTLLSQFGLS